ncbi:MAG: hypothetical protein D6701_13305, partial [Gemmatimonadetes bacterium]
MLLHVLTASLVTVSAPPPAFALAARAGPDTVRWTPPPLPWPPFLDPERAFGRGRRAEPIGRLGLAPLPPFRRVSPEAPLVVQQPGLQRPAAWLLQPGWLRVRRAVERSRARLPGLLHVPAPAARTLARAARLGEAGEEGGARGLSEALSDLDVSLIGRAELGGDWTRFRPCDADVQFACDPDLIPRLDPDLQFGGRIEGTVAERISIDVDFDQAREFGGANDVRIRYDGARDDVLQSLEVGDVTFDLPASRFLTEGIPAGNFGFLARGQVGPVFFRGVWAQQRGDLSRREFRLSGPPGEETFVQVDTLVLDDADYVKGQFFFLVDPRSIEGFPHVDVLDLDASRVPADVAPGPDPVQVYRFEVDPVSRQLENGLIQADAVAQLGTDRVEESGWFRYLQPGEDYVVHPSGLWIALRSPLRRDEVLAVTYVTATGDTVGTYNPERVYNRGERPRLQLLKASNAQHQPGRPTWDFEMHQVYRVSTSSDVAPEAVELTISVGELSAGRTFRTIPSGEDATFLRLFGMDEESPLDHVDRSHIYRPAEEFFEDRPAVEGVFLVFPTLRPFLDPPPVRSLDLTAEQVADVLGADRNAAIYDADDPFDRDAGGLYRLTIPFERRSEGVISSFSLGAIGIREGSERIFLGDRLLLRDVDYRIDYDIGQVSLIQPDALFAQATDPVVRASWEQRSIFRVAPTSVAGLDASWRLGRAGTMHLL